MFDVEEDVLDLNLRSCRLKRMPGVFLPDSEEGWIAPRNHHLWKLGRLGEAYLDLRGIERIHGQALDAAEKVRLGLRDQGWASHEGLSLSLAAARVAARFEDQIRAVEIVAESRFLSPHPLSALPSLEPRSRDRLHHFGLQQIGQIQPIELGTLERLMPRDQAILVLRQARGEDQENLPSLEIVQATEIVRQVFHPPLPRYEVHLASWAWGSFWEWRLDGGHLLSTRLTWWDLDELHHQVKWTSHGEDLWTASQMDVSRWLTFWIGRGDAATGSLQRSRTSWERHSSPTSAILQSDIGL